MTLSAVALMSMCSALDAKDYIARGDALFDQSLPVFRHYDREVKRILHRAWERDVIVRAVHLPPFDPEWIVGVTRSANGYRAFLLEASYFIWQAMNDEKEKFPSIHGIYHKRPLDEAAALRIAALWRAVLSAPQNFGKDPTIYGDSSTFHFFVGAAPHEHLAGYTSHVFDHAQAEVLTIVAGKLYDYATRKPGSESKLQQEIGRAERKLHLQPRSASNQAMQRTAPRSDA